MQKLSLEVFKSYFLIYHAYSRHCQFGFLLSLLESIFIGIYYYLSIYLVDTLHYEMSTAGIIISCYGVGAILGGLVGGKLSDNWAPGIVSSCSLFIQAISYFLFTQINSMYLLMFNVFVLGIASYGFITANHLFVLGNCRNSENKRLQAISILSMTSNLGLGISALILGGILSIGFYSIFLFTSLLIFLLACVSVYYELTLTNQNGFLVNQEHQLRNNVSRTDLNVFLTVLISVFFVGMIVTQSGATYAIYIKELFPSFGIQAVTILFAINSFMVVIASTLICELIKDFNKILMVGLGGFLIGIGMFMLTFSHSFIMAVLSCIIYTLGEIIFFSVAQLLCYQSGMEKKGSSLGLYRVIYALSRVLGPSAGGYIYYTFGGDMLWRISGFIGVVCLIFCTILCTTQLKAKIRILS